MSGGSGAVVVGVGVGVGVGATGGAPSPARRASPSLPAVVVLLAGLAVGLLCGQMLMRAAHSALVRGGGQQLSLPVAVGSGGGGGGVV